MRQHPAVQCHRVTAGSCELLYSLYWSAQQNHAANGRRLTHGQQVQDEQSTQAVRNQVRRRTGWYSTNKACQAQGAVFGSRFGAAIRERADVVSGPAHARADKRHGPWAIPKPRNQDDFAIRGQLRQLLRLAACVARAKRIHP